MIEIVKDQEKLCSRCDEIFAHNGSAIVKNAIKDMKYIMKKNNLKYISAPQVGHNYRIFCIDYDGDIQEYINPVVADEDGFVLVKQYNLVDDKEYLVGRVDGLSITYQIKNGECRSNKLIGLAAHIAQLCINYLDGITLNDIGMQLDDDFDGATDEEKDQLANMYFEMLKKRNEEISDKVANDEESQKLKDAIEFMKSVNKGETKVEYKKIKMEEKREDE